MVGVSTQTRSRLGHEATDQFEYADRFDHGPYAAFNISLFGGVIKLGISGVPFFVFDTQLNYHSILL